MIHVILFVQFTCLIVFFHSLSPSFLWSTYCPSTLHFILHTFLHPVIVFFSQHMPIPLTLFCCCTKIMSSNPSLSVNPLLGTLSCSFTPSDYSHFCPQKCHLISFSYGLGLTSMQHTTSYTTAVQCPSHSHTHTTILLLFCNMSGTTQVSRYQKGKTRKVKPIWIYWSKR